jgi:type I restriction enzyme M protein
MSLTSTIKTIQDIMRKDVGVDGDAQRMSQLIWMLFLKILDEQEKQIEEVQNYTSPIKEEFRWRNWAAVEKEEQKTSDQLIEFINNDLFPGLKDINNYRGNSKLREVIQSVFEDAYNYIKSGSLLRQVIIKIEEDIPLKSFEDQKHLGDVYEKLLKDLQSAGNAGEFYTPRAVTEFVVDRVAPRIGETILDPACGTGGFLAQAVDYLNKSKREESAETLQNIQDAPRGIEKKPLPHLLAVTNMILHGIKEPFRIERKNTLELYTDWTENNKVDIVITNPPFGGMEEEGIENSFPNEFRTRETTDLFIYFIYSKMLKNGGRCAIVLPDGFLFGEGIKSRIKEDLMEKCNLHTIVRLPNGVFNPYTGIKTNILFFEKTDKEKDSTQTIWFYEHPYPEGYKNYSKTRPMQFREFQAEQEWWGDLYDTLTYEKRNDSKYAWKIDFRKEKTEALAKAEPYYNRASEYEKQKREKNEEIKELNAAIRKLRKEITSLKSKEDEKQVLKKEIEVKQELIKAFKQEAAKLERKAKDEQDSGDRIKYAVYNLDRNNPHTQERVLDVTELILEFEQIQARIYKVQEQLKDKLAQAFIREVE